MFIIFLILIYIASLKIVNLNLLIKFFIITTLLVLKIY